MKTYGEIAGFPEEIVEKMLERQVEAGFPRDVSVFERMKFAGHPSKGFDWDKTIEGNKFWKSVIQDRDFDLFFEKYPNKPTYPKLMEVDNDSSFLNPRRRVVFMERNGKYLAWAFAKTMIESEKESSACTWSYVRDIEPEPIEEIVELTIEDISNGKGIGIKPHLIRIKK